ncbi:MAG: SAM-dependent methyltransferase, partial [Alphaproteobacteria bacterium]|nr:SAM-dependent methyltransferase [Alphaproteobacteria bacterium]
MAEALYGPEGYYTHGRNFTTTPPRDFTTAPELTPLFGATVANWVAARWQALGAPNPFILAELGPGRGRLMQALLTHLQAAHPACFAALQQVVSIEVSPFLIQLQRETLQHFSSRCTWATTLTASAAPLILVANEVLDALPAQPYRLTATGWEQLTVQDNTLHWEPCDQPTLPHGWQPDVGASFDALPDLATFLTTIHQHASAALLLDYGSPTLPANSQSTLQALQHHQRVDLLHEPGNTDLTVHINFAEVMHQLGPTQCTLTPLADFLLRHGLTD